MFCEFRPNVFVFKSLLYLSEARLFVSKVDHIPFEGFLAQVIVPLLVHNSLDFFVYFSCIQHWFWKAVPLEDYSLLLYCLLSDLE